MKMKLLFYSIIFFTFFSSCEKPEENVSRVTYFPEFDYKGSEVILLPCATQFNEPGVTATEKGQQITVNKVVSKGVYFGSPNDLTSIAPDKYVINYSAVNVDGFSGERSRTIFAACNGDLNNSLEGLYSSTVVRNGVVSAQYQNLKYVIIKKSTDGTYAVSDAIGGYYEYGRGFGDAYACLGLGIKVLDLASNSFEFIQPSAGVGAFGGNIKISECIVNNIDQTIIIKSKWVTSSTFDFVVTLKQIKI